MQLKYVDTKEEIIAINRKSKHIEPHLHNALEIVCVTSGALEFGVGQELYHMEKGDIGFVFPDVIHHYQVLTPGVNKATYLIASPFTIAKLQISCNPWLLNTQSSKRKRLNRRYIGL